MKSNNDLLFRIDLITAEYGDDPPSGLDVGSMTIPESLPEKASSQASTISPDPLAERSTEGHGNRADHLVVWLPDDSGNPQNWSLCSKWAITILTSFLTLNSTIASSAPSVATLALVNQFNTTEEVATLVTSLFLCGYVAGPIIWAPLSEMIGRRPVFIMAITVYTILQLGVALNTNLVTILIFRFLLGLSAAAPLSNSGGVIADIWDAAQRPQAMSIFFASVSIGPVIGPIIGSFIVESHLGYRWIFWILMMFSGVTTLATVFLFPETYSPILLTRKAKRLRQETGNEKYHAAHETADFSIGGVIRRTILRPFEMLWKESILLLATSYLAIVYGLLYSLFEAFPIIWGEIRHFTSLQTSLIFIGFGIGSTIGALLNVYLSRPMVKLVPKWRGHPPCEMNLYGAMASGPFLVVAIFWLGWTGAYASIPWWIPAIPTILLGISFTLLFTAFLAYLVDVYLMFAASALAANTIVRSAVGAAFPLFTRQMFNKMGTQWALTMIGYLALLLMPIPFVFYKIGPKLRMGSTFAPALDIQMKHKIQEEEIHKATKNKHFAQNKV